MVGTPLPSAVPRDASTVLSLTEHAKFFRPKPELKVIDPLRCVNLGSSDKPIYHGRGLLPAVLSHDTWVLTPFLYSPKANKQWGLRRLGIRETLSCLDFPDDWAKWLAAAGVDRAFVAKQPAMACFVAGATRWLTALFSDNEGGKKRDYETSKKRDFEIPEPKMRKKGRVNSLLLASTDLPPINTSKLAPSQIKIDLRRARAIKESQKYDSIQERQVLKRRRQEEDEVPAKCEAPSSTVSSSPEKITTSKCEAPSTTTLSSCPDRIKKPKANRAGTKPPKPTKRDRNNAHVLPRRSCLIESPVTISDDNSDATGAHDDAEELFPNEDSGFVPLEHPSKKSTHESTSTNQPNKPGIPRPLDDSATDMQEQKAVKADNAAVPIHLWEKNLFDASPKWAAQKGRFRAACKVLRGGMLAYWKVLVQRSLTNWLALRHPELQSNGSTTKRHLLVQTMPP
jgi:hypothetical protein